MDIFVLLFADELFMSFLPSFQIFSSTITNYKYGGGFCRGINRSTKKG